MKLLVDWGNSRLKWGVLSGRRLQPGAAFAHVGKSLTDQLHKEWDGLVGVGGVLVASVVDEAREEELAVFVREQFGMDTEWIRSPAAALGVRNAYAQPAQLGVDRFLALAAAHARMPRVQVLVSAGTATTVDALDAKGNHLGGLIVAGTRLMREALLRGTARVDAINGEWREWPRSTADAVATGALHATAGAIDRFRVSLQQRCGRVPALILTGGGGAEIEALIAPAERVPDLVLQGLALWALAASQHR